ncbi:MAG TPA: hypothetical protein VK943_01035 [Arenibaculum sp.]|nr:hypothetical protein [Arenibaculum sp.]
MTFDMGRAVDMTCRTMEDYAAVLETETEAIRAVRMDEVTTLAPRKEKLAHQLDVLLGGLRDDGERFTAHVRSRPELRGELEMRWNRLTALAVENAQALQRALAITQEVVGLVVEVARSSQRAQAGYAAAGYGRKGAPGGPMAARAGISVALDTKL